MDRDDQSTSDQDLTDHLDEDIPASTTGPDACTQDTALDSIHDGGSDGSESEGSLSSGGIPIDADLFDWPESPKRDDNDTTLAQALQEQMTVAENNLIRNYEDIRNLVRRGPPEVLDRDLENLGYIVQTITNRPELLSYFDEGLAEHIHSKGNGQVGILADDVQEWWRFIFLPRRGEFEPFQSGDSATEPHRLELREVSSRASDLSGDDDFDISRVTISPACSQVGSEASELATLRLQGVS
ncbi:hypothetical protein VP1G_07475 [Cytospora mali]|uniref:Uncharacterized protein n=1 Tax=Cytospora mali TaxID=578113 RepID=A0A194V8M8_CYTMA|nr:hypothetical protein VP1G_07475 [Valsa mali var. pyri (nom. inval.)]